MPAYDATFTGTNGTDLSAYTSDSGHTHTKESGSGSLQLNGGELIAIGLGNDSIYTSDWDPSGADQTLTATFAGNDGGNNTIDVGIHCQADGDGIWVQWETFSADPGVINLVFKTDAGATEDTQDSVVPSGFVDVIVEVVVADNEVSWSVAGTPAGSGFAVPAQIQGPGTLAYNKFNSSTTSEGVALQRVEAEEAGGTDYSADPNAAAASASGPTPGVTTLTRPYTIITIA